MRKPFKISNKTRSRFKTRKRIISSIEKGRLPAYDIPQRLLGKRDVLSAAIEQNWRALAYAAPKLKEDPALSHLAEEQKEAQTAPKSQSLNFLWLNLDLPAKPDPEDGSIRMPLPEEYIGNVRDAGKRHPHADIHLWIDSKRLTEKQLQYLHAVVEKDMPNVHVKDLRSIPEYANEELYNRTETKSDWRSGYSGVVWLQVDAAKILISLQGDYNQRFFADLDHAHVDIESPEVQERLEKYGMLIGSGSAGYSWIENQLWGFDRTRKDFFSEYYKEGLKRSYKGRIAYESLRPQVSEKIFKPEHVGESQIVLPIGSKGLEHAVQPGHEWSEGSSYSYNDYKGRSFVPADELSKIFNSKSPKPSSAVKTPASSATKPATRAATPLRRI